MSLGAFFVAAYTFICIGPDAVVLYKDEKYDGYEDEEKHLIEEGNYLVGPSFPEEGQWINGVPGLLDKFSEAFERADEVFPDSGFKVCKNYSEVEDFIKQVSQAAELPFDFIRKFICVMTYEQVVASKETGIIFATDFYNT